MGNKQTTTPATISDPPPPYSISVPTVAPNVPQPLYDNSNPQPQTSKPAARVVSMQGLPQEAPALMFCPFCQTTVVTTAKCVIGSHQWHICISLSLAFLFCFAWIPFVVDAWKDVEHSCSRCGRVIHIYRK
ncbi:lipopolysaccharide-induced tumor necrosis factor-alpha factor homolog [Synchiropus picturatus]